MITEDPKQYLIVRFSDEAWEEIKDIADELENKTPDFLIEKELDEFYHRLVNEFQPLAQQCLENIFSRFIEERKEKNKNNVS